MPIESKIRTVVLLIFVLLLSNYAYSQNTSDFERYKTAQKNAFHNYKLEQEKAFKQFKEDRKVWNKMLLGIAVDDDDDDEYFEMPSYIDAESTLEKEIEVVKDEYNKKEKMNYEQFEEAENNYFQEKEISESTTKKKTAKELINGKQEEVVKLIKPKSSSSDVVEKKEEILKELIKNKQNLIPSISPIANSYRISSKFGWRTHPFYHRRKFHDGIDLACSVGTPIRLPADGKVSKAGYNGSYGNYILIEHTDGYKTAYAHLSQIEVRVGQVLKKNELIGKVGSTGRSTGAHLHYEVIRNNKKVDPLEYFRQKI